MIKTLNSLRFILILMIMICHSSLPISDGVKAYLGECPVAIFFVISGFVLSLSYGERLQSEEVSNKKFFLSRVFKIYPLHLLIIAILLPMDWRLGQLKPWYQVLAHATLLQCWLPTYSFEAALNGPVWFLSDIIFFYLVFEWLYCWIKNKSWLQVISVMGIYMGGYVSLTLMVSEDYSAGYIYWFPLFRIVDFSLGILLYRFYLTQRSKKWIDYITIFSENVISNIMDILLIVMMIGLCLLSVHINPNFRCAALYWLPSMIVVFYVVACDKSNHWLTLVLHNKRLLWLGSISFELFLCHGLVSRIVQSVFLKIYDENIPYLGSQFMITLCLSILVAWLSKKYVVEPCYGQLKKR